MFSLFYPVANLADQVFVKMPKRNPIKNDQLRTSDLRRSSRFRHIKPPDSESPKTPLLTEQRNRTTTNNKKVKEETKKSRILSRLADVLDEKKLSPTRSCNQANLESNRRLTRSCCEDSDKIAKKIDYGGSTGNKNRRKTEDCEGTSKSLTGKSSKNQMKDSKKCSKDDCDRAAKSVLVDKVNKRVSSIKEVHVLNDELPKKHIDKSDKRTDVRVVEVPKLVGTKRKRDQLKNDGKISHGWSKDQELALERAYLIANPTPHFWKKVSRMVPGKSAQECFDKIHCSHLTPPHPRQRSRAASLISQNNNLSASKLLDSSSQKVAKPRSRRQKRHVIQRTVRHLLQKQYKVEKDSDSDLFSVLEPASSPSHRPITTPVCLKGEVLKKRLEGSLTAFKKTRSRFSSSTETPIFSPPVLKQVKNIVLHEKYIDQLNCREANRKAASSKEGKKGVTHESSVRRKDAIKAAKNALVFDAKDAISQFQDQQVKALSIIFDDENESDSDKEKESPCLFSF